MRDTGAATTAREGGGVGRFVPAGCLTARTGFPPDGRAVVRDGPSTVRDVTVGRAADAP